MPVAAEEFTDPISYSWYWLWLALLALVLVIGWYAGVTVWAHGRRWRDGGPPPVPTARDRALFELDQIGHQVAAGGLTERDGYQQMSRVVRTFVADMTGLPAQSMALADLNAAGVTSVAEAIALMYPPEFAPAPAPQYEPIDHTLARARALVVSWT